MPSDARRPVTSPPDGMALRHAFLIAIILALAARLAMWFGTIAVPIPNEALQPISPLHANSAIDLPFYQTSRAIYGAWIERFAAAPWNEWGTILGALLDHIQSNFLAGPLMAGLLALFDYTAANTLPLATVYLAMSCALAVAWLRWFRMVEAGTGACLILALIPGPLWFMLNISSDLPFAALVTAFFFTFFSRLRLRQRYIWGMLIAVVATLLRPHGISLFLFMGLHAAFLSPARTRIQKIAVASVLVLAGAAFLVLFQTYFESYLRSSNGLDYFGYTSVEYLGGIFPGLPGGLNEAASWLALLLAKLLYLAGLRPSYGETSLTLVLIRAAPGLILLPGVLYGFFRAPWAYRLLLAAFFAPVALGAAQDRYLLAVTPLLVLFALRAAEELRGSITGRRPVFPPLPLEHRATPAYSP